ILPFGGELGSLSKNGGVQQNHVGLRSKSRGTYHQIFGGRGPLCISYEHREPLDLRYGRNEIANRQMAPAEYAGQSVGGELPSWSSDSRSCGGLWRETANRCDGRGRQYLFYNEQARLCYLTPGFSILNNRS